MPSNFLRFMAAKIGRIELGPKHLLGIARQRVLLNDAQCVLALRRKIGFVAGASAC